MKNVNLKNTASLFLIGLVILCLVVLNTTSSNILYYAILAGGVLALGFGVFTLLTALRLGRLKNYLGDVVAKRDISSYEYKQDSSYVGAIEKDAQALVNIAQDHNRLTQLETAINTSQAIIEFTAQGVIKTANENFCQAMGYSLAEIKGQHHSLFVDSEYANSPEYKGFWHKLQKGEFQQAEFQRFGKGNKEIWLQASYNPIFDQNGKVENVIKYASDITQHKLLTIDYLEKIDVLNNSQAIIEFDLKGIIQSANVNFCNAVGYDLSEIKGKHHRIFCASAYANSNEYQNFWDALRSGEFQQAEFQRFGKGNKEIWIQASYNPIMDNKGKVKRIVKYASDITDVIQARLENNRMIQKFVSVLEAISNGDLNQRITAEASGEFKAIRDAINANVGRLSQTMNKIVTLSQTINGASQDIMKGSDDLSRRTEAQAANIEQTVATMEEISASVRNNANGAIETSGLATEALEQAEKGSEIVSQAVGAMQHLEQSSHQIAEIVSVIDSIASQTNLLALNAAVEAARAGEAGKGFAVVASEVRTLASRCSDAARDIRGLISSSNTQVINGVKLVNETGTALHQIVESITSVSQTITSISLASREQATGVEEISGAISQMDQMTQQNASLSDESATSARSLAKESENLSGLVDYFKTSGDAGSASEMDAFRNIA